MERLPELDTNRVLWIVLGLAITAVVAFVVFSFIGAIAVGIFLYYALRPAYQWLDDRLDHPDVAATLTLLVVGLPMLVILGYAGLMALRELNLLFQQQGLQSLRRVIQPYINLSSLTGSGSWINDVQASIPRLVSFVKTVFVWGVRLFVLVVVAFYLLRDDRKIAAWFRESMEDRFEVVEFMEGVDEDLTTIYTGNLLTIAITAIVAAVVYYGLNMIAPQGARIMFPVLLGLLTGIATLVPAVGMKIVYLPYTGYLLWQAWQNPGVPYWFPVAFLVVTFVVVDTIPDVFIRSYVSKGRLNMGLMILTYVLGAMAFGWYGVFLGPILLVLFLHFARRVFPNVVDDGASRFVTDWQM